MAASATPPSLVHVLAPSAGPDPDDDDPREELEFLLGQVRPLLRCLGDARGDDAVRLLAARRRLQDWLGERVFAYVAAGGSVRLE